MSCTFRAAGFNFDVDEFLRQNEVAPLSVGRKGEPQSTTKIREWSSLMLTASRAHTDQPQQQVEDAIGFLKANHAILEKLQHFPGIDELCLDFGIDDRDVGVQCDRFPPELLRLAGNLNITIEITRYH